MKEIQIDFSAPINKGDTELTTMGCRHTNPEICKNNGIPNICAFASEDHICKKPSCAWKKKYIQLVENKEVGNICEK